MSAEKNENVFSMFARKHSKHFIDEQGILHPDGTNTDPSTQPTYAIDTAHKSVNVHLGKYQLNNTVFMAGNKLCIAINKIPTIVIIDK